MPHQQPLDSSHPDYLFRLDQFIACKAASARYATPRKKPSAKQLAEVKRRKPKDRGMRHG